MTDPHGTDQQPGGGRPDPARPDPARNGDKARRRLRGRNIALLIALIAFVALIYMVSMVRMQAGVEAGLEQQRQAETPEQVEDGPAEDGPVEEGEAE
jgi:hypothetical protein